MAKRKRARSGTGCKTYFIKGHKVRLARTAKGRFKACSKR